MILALSIWILQTTLQAQIPKVNGDFLEEIQNIRSQMPRADSEGFVKPTTDELASWQKLMAYLIDLQIARADSLVQLRFPFYDFLQFKDTGFNDETYFMLREKFPITQGWGTVVVNPNFERQLNIEIPHPVFDLNTHREGADIFRRTGARILLMAGTHRCANSELSGCSGTFTGCGGQQYPVSDMAHAVETAFQTAHETFDQQIEPLTTFSLHGNSRSNCEDIFLSNGSLFQAKALLLQIKNHLRTIGNIDAAVAGDGTSSCPLTGSTNVQGRFSNGSTLPCTRAAAAVTGRFIHVEQSRQVRDNFALYSKLIDAIRANFDSVTAVVKPEPISRNPVPPLPQAIHIFPNPFKSSTTIHFQVSAGRTSDLKIYNLRGQVVRVLHNSFGHSPGEVQLTWDGKDEHGRSVPAGVYFVAIVSDKHMTSAKITLLR